MTETPLDKAHAAMELDPDNAALRLRFFERLADCELFLLLDGQASGDQVNPRIFPVEGQRFVLMFDREERLTEFTGGPADYARLPGRRAVEMLAGLDVGIGLNLEVATSSMLLPAESVDWLAATLAGEVEEIQARPETISSPSALPETLLSSLDTKLALTAGMAKLAYLAGVTYSDGRQSHLLAFVDASDGSEDALATAVREALVFSGIEAGVLDVAFIRASDDMAASLSRHGLRFDLPEPVGDIGQPSAPGMDPDRPPILR